jgi:hypothetical protein
MNTFHNGGFPPIFEGGKKEVMQREFSAENILSMSQILNKVEKPEIVFKRAESRVFNILDKPKIKKNK